MKHIALSILFFVLMPLPTHAFFGIGSGVGGCGASSVVQGAVSQAKHAAASQIGSLTSGGGIAGGILGGEVPVKDDRVRDDTNTLVAKECVGDPLTIALRELLIAELTRNIINWANTGFEGAPVFVTDLGRLLQGVADDAVSNFIYGGDLGGICSPYQQDIRTIVARQYTLSLPQSFTQRVSCQFDANLGNQEAFLEGDFSQGGWEAWWITFTEENPWRRLSQAEQEKNRRIAEEQETVEKQVDQGEGFLPNAGCDFVQGATQNPYLLNVASSQSTGGSLHTIDTNTRSGCHAAGGSWNIYTPGVLISNEVSNVLGTGRRQLEEADEIDEIINLLLAQLAQKAFSGVGGFTGLSKKSADPSLGGQSYVEALVSETSNESISEAQNVLLINVEGAIELETRFRNAAVVLIDELENTEEALFICFANITRIESAAQEDYLTLYRAELTKSENTLAELDRIYEQASRSITEDSLNRAAESYDALIAADSLHNIIDAEQAEDALTSLIAIGNERDTVCSVNSDPI